jgi:hypothetical protein
LVCKYAFKVRSTARRIGFLTDDLSPAFANQPQIPTRVLDDDSNTSEGGYSDEDEDDEDEKDEDKDATGDED